MRTDVYDKCCSEAEAPSRGHSAVLPCKFPNSFVQYPLLECSRRKQQLGAESESKLQGTDRLPFDLKLAPVSLGATGSGTGAMGFGKPR